MLTILQGYSFVSVSFLLYPLFNPFTCLYVLSSKIVQHDIPNLVHRPKLPVSPHNFENSIALNFSSTYLIPNDVSLQSCLFCIFMCGCSTLRECVCKCIEYPSLDTPLNSISSYVFTSQVRIRYFTLF